MCSYKTWYYEEQTGYVIACGKCRKIQAGFGNVMLTFLPAAFDNFRKQIGKVYERRQVPANTVVKSIMIPTPCEGLTLLLNGQELEELYAMLEGADSEMRAEQLLQLFYKEEDK